MRVLVMMPTFNEAQGLEAVVQRVLDVNPTVDILIIDDNSPDGTGAIANALTKDSRIHVLHRSGKQGLGKAYLAGYAWGMARDYERLVQMDADGSHRSEDLAALLASEADLVIGSRWITGGEVENWPKSREFISRLGNSYASLTTGIKLGDLTAGYRCYSRKALGAIDLTGLEARGYGFQIEMTRRAVDRQLQIAEVPIKFVERENGRSKMTFEIIVEAFLLCTKWGIARLVRR